MIRSLPSSGGWTLHVFRSTFRREEKVEKIQESGLISPPSKFSLSHDYGNLLIHERDRQNPFVEPLV